MRSIMKKSLAVVLTFVLVLSGLTGITPMESQAATYKTLTFSDWGIQDGDYYGAGVSVLQDAQITSLNGYAFEGIVNFKGAVDGSTNIRIGTSPDPGNDPSAPFRGLGIWTEGGTQLQVYNFINDGDGTSTYTPQDWSNAANMRLRLTFDETAVNTWSVGIWVNGTYIGEKVLTNTSLGTQLLFMTADAETTVYFESVEEAPDLDEKTTLTFSDWGIQDGDYYGGGLFLLQDATITSLDGYAFEGFINFKGALYGSTNIRIGTSPDPGNDPSAPYRGLGIWSEGSSQMQVYNFVNDGDGISAFAPEDWSNNGKMKIRFTFDETATKTWTIGIWVNDTYMGEKILTNTSLGTQLLFMTESAEAAIYFESVEEVTGEYQNMTFSDWGIRDGDYSGGRTFVLQDTRITSLDGYAFEGIVNFYGAADGNTTLRIGTNPATPEDSIAPFKGITIWAEGNTKLCVHNFINNDDGTSVFEPEGWSNAENMKLRLTFDETAKNTWTIGIWVNENFVGEKTLTNTALGTQILYGTTTSNSLYFESVGEGITGGSVEISYEDYLAPIWEGDIVYDESVMPLSNADGTIDPIQLAYDIDEIVSVKSANLLVTYEAGKDYTIENGKLVIPSGSSIKVTPYGEYYLSAPIEGNCFACTNGGYIYFSEGTHFQQRQIVVTYKHSDMWTGSIPKKQGAALTNILTKLNNQEPVNIVFYGDSITVGANASSFIGASPFLETYAELVTKTLKEKYEYDDISYINTALGGQLTEWGVANADVLAADKNPDLMVLAFGMNDINTEPATYQAQIEQIIDIVREKNADCDIVLVGTMLPNAEAAGAYGNQELFITNLNAVAAKYENVVVADMTTMHGDLLARKSYRDMTGNNVNHPNDFLGRVYAQVVLEALTDEREEEYKELSFSDWGIDMGVVNGNKTYALTDDTLTDTLDGVAISGNVNFNGTAKYFNIGGTATLRHAGFWLFSTGSELHISPQGIGGPAADATVINAAEWATLSTEEFNLRLTFDKKSSGWLVNIYVEGVLKLRKTFADVEPGLYIGNAPEITVERTVVLKEKQNVKYFVDTLDNIKWLGRTGVVDAGVTADATATGFEANVTANGSVVLDAAVMADTYFAVYIDGVRQAEAVKITPTQRRAEIASFSDGKEHHIRVVKQTEANGGLCTMISLEFDGNFGTKPANKDLYIEIMGDSITAGGGNLILSGQEGTVTPDYDGTLAFPFLTAEKLDADVSVVSCSGIGASAHPDTHWFIEKDFYTRASFFRDENVYYEFERVPDVVVINLGTNDVMAYAVDKDTFIPAAKELIQLVREKYNENVKIIWTDNMMGYTVKDWVLEAFADLGGEQEGLYLLQFEPNIEGGYKHPTKEAHEVSAEALSAYIGEILEGNVIKTSVDEGGYVVTHANTVINGVVYQVGDVFDEVGVHSIAYMENGVAVETSLIVYLVGDANKDSQVNLKDLMRAKHYICGEKTADEQEKAGADMNQDNRLKDEDAELLRNKLIKSK